jgi:transmembrane sensor
VEARLPDGSHVVVNSGGRAVVTYGLSRRRVALDGEALFDVAPDRKRPFEVTTQRVEVIVTGTRFAASDRRGETEIILTHGEVRLARAPGGTVVAVLKPGDRARIGDGGRIERDRPASIEAELSWSQGRLTFNDERLGDAFEAFERYRVERVRFRDQRLADLPVSGLFKPMDFEAFLKGSARLHGLSVRKVGPHEYELDRARS